MVTISTDGAAVRLSGKLTTQSAAQAFKNTPEFTEPLYCVDLREIVEIDSAGLAVLLYWRTRAKDSSSELKFKNPPDKLLQIAELGGLAAIFFDRKP